MILRRESGPRSRLAAENARLRRQAQEALEVREEFLSLASHELKTPLTGLQLQVSAIQRALAGRDPPDLRKIGSRVNSIDRQLGRLTGIVDSLLDVSRADAEHRQLKTEHVDLAVLVGEVAMRFRDELAAKGYTLSLDIDGPIVGRWDRLKLDEIVTNFLTNAVTFGAGKPIAISVRRSTAQVTIEVLDHGIGISAVDQKRIFGRFSRAASSGHYGGLGLGLWNTKALVEAMGGQVEVLSVVGCGSTFRAVLPVETGHGDASPS